MSDRITDSAIITRFEKYIGPVETCGCRLWTGGLMSTKKNQDYGGYFRVTTVDRDLAHRIAYRIYKGEIPAGMLVRHTCDTPRCVAEEHLELGTYKQNTQDMIDRGRSRFGILGTHGEEHSRAKLTTVQVEAIRLDTRSQRVIAAENGISQPLVSYIQRGRARRFGLAVMC